MRLPVILVAILVVSSGCLESPEGPEVDADIEVMVGEMYFQQEGLEEDVLEASIGDSMAFFNEGDVPHTVTIPELDVDEHVEPGEAVQVEASQELEEALVDCTYHGSHEAYLTVN